MSRVGSILDIRSQGGRSYELLQIDEAAALRAKETLAAIGARPELWGLTEGEVLIALGSNRDSLSPFGGLMKLQGHAMKYLGASLGASLMLICLAFGVVNIGQRGIALVGEAMRFLRRLDPRAAIAAATDADGVADEDVSGVLFAFLPGPLAAVLAGVLGKFGSPGSVQAGGGDGREAAANNILSALVQHDDSGSSDHLGS